MSDQSVLIRRNARSKKNLNEENESVGRDAIRVRGSCTSILASISVLVIKILRQESDRLVEFGCIDISSSTLFSKNILVMTRQMVATNLR